MVMQRQIVNKHITLRKLYLSLVYLSFYHITDQLISVQPVFLEYRKYLNTYIVVMQCDMILSTFQIVNDERISVTLVSMHFV